MNTQKTQPAKQSDNASDVSKKESGGLATAQFVDNRTEASTIEQFQQLANASQQSNSIMQFQEIADTHAESISMPGKEKNETGLPDQLKSGIENLSGYSLDDVKVHYNSDKPAQLHAHAYAQGTDIHIASGQEKHVGHEAWHVVQQKQGRVKPTKQLKGAHINDNKELEQEADIMGAKAGIQGTTQLKKIKTAGGSFSSIIQRTEIADAVTNLNQHKNDYNHIRNVFDNEVSNINKVAPNGDAAQGIKHWSKETQRAAVREYNELFALKKEGGINNNARLGKSNITESDVVAGDGKGLIEVKTNDTERASDVDKLVDDALWQLWMRYNKKKHTTLTVYVFLENKSNHWPYTTKEDPKDFSSSGLAKRLKDRNVGYSMLDPYTIIYRVYYSSLGEYKEFKGKLNKS